MSETLSYEEARNELLRVVQTLEAGGTSLQESMELWERGEELATVCQRWLDGARARFDAVVSQDLRSDIPDASGGSARSHEDGEASGESAIDTAPPD
jgi:exodeoxyribonuclease VII small subunit